MVIILYTRMNGTNVFLGLVVLLLLLVAVQIMRWGNFLGEYVMQNVADPTEAPVPLKLTEVTDPTTGKTVVEVQTGPKKHVLGKINLNNSRDLYTDGKLVPEVFQMEWLSGDITVVVMEGSTLKTYSVTPVVPPAPAAAPSTPAATPAAPPASQ